MRPAMNATRRWVLTAAGLAVLTGLPTAPAAAEELYGPKAAQASKGGTLTFGSLVEPDGPWSGFARDTVEERVLRMQEKKRELLAGAVDADTALASLAVEDLRELVG